MAVIAAVSRALRGGSIRVVIQDFVRLVAVVREFLVFVWNILSLLVKAGGVGRVLRPRALFCSFPVLPVGAAVAAAWASW